MLLPILALLVALAMAFTVLTFLNQDRNAKILCLMLSIIMWLGASIGSAIIDIPYQAYDSSDNTIVEGVQRFAGTEPGVPWVLMGIGILMIIYAWYLVTGEGLIYDARNRAR